MGTSAVIDAAGLDVLAALSPPSALCRRRHDWQLPRTPTTLFYGLPMPSSSSRSVIDRSLRPKRIPTGSLFARRKLG